MNTSIENETSSRRTEGDRICVVQTVSSLRELHVAFEVNQVQISEEQAARIKAWRVRWPTLPNKVDVIFGGASHTSRVGRLRRLYGLITLLERLGVATKRIFPDLEWTQPVRMGALDDIPADTIWLRLSPHARHRFVT